MSTRPVRVTDHAVIRYLERIAGVDVDGARRALQHAAQLAEEHDGANRVICQGVKFYIRNHTLTTVMPANRPDPRTGKVRKGPDRDPDDLS